MKPVARHLRYVVVRTTNIHNDLPTVVGMFKVKPQAEEYAWRCASRYTLPDTEILYTVHAIAWEVKGDS